MSERTASLPRPRRILPLRLAVGSLSAVLIACSYPIALIEAGLTIGPYHIPAPLLRLALYTLLHVAGLAAIGMTVLWLECRVDRYAERTVQRIFNERRGAATKG